MNILLIAFLVALFLVWYIYFGYPFLIMLLSYLHHSPIKKQAITPSITLIIPAYNEADVIAKKLDSVLEMQYPRDKLQIIAANDGSTDQTEAIINSYAAKGIELSSGGVRRGKVATMNTAVHLAKGEIIAFTDADVTCEPDALMQMVSNFADHSVGCVTSGHRIVKSGSAVGASNDLYWRYESFIKTCESQVHSSAAASGHLLAVRRELIDPLPEGVIIDDFYRALTVLRQGYRVIYEPKAVCWQRPVVSMEDEIVRRKRITSGRYQVMLALAEFLPHLPFIVIFELVSHKFLRPFLPFFMLLALILNAPLIFGSNWLGAQYPVLYLAVAASFIAQAVFYLAALFAPFALRLGVKSKLFAVPHYIVTSNIAGLQGLFWFLSGRRTVLWEQANRG